MKIIKENNASAFMAINAILWGSSYIWSKMLLGYLPYFTILLVYSIGGLAALFMLFPRRIKTIGRRTVIIGMSIGGLSILSNIFCMLALGSTSSSNTAFIVQMSVIITPLIMSTLQKKFPGGRVILSALTAMTGLLLLTCDFSSFRFNPGDLFALANALFFSLYLAALKIYSGKTDPVQFTFMQHVLSTAAFLGMALAFEMQKIDYSRINMSALAILVLSTVISVSTILIQSSAIKHVRPEKATVIYTLEPVAAAVLAYFLIGERLDGIRPLAGCVMILFAIVITIYRKRDVMESAGLKSTFEMKLTKTL